MEYVNDVPEMKMGNQNAIVNGLHSTAPVQRVNGIIYAVRYCMTDPNVIKAIEDLTRDESCLFSHNTGYKVSHFAIAALALLGIHAYEGRNPTILSLIQTKLEL
ncbi:MAG: hypothetical protein J5449_07365 [Oscillospiraceae bacterium]|nr:hypothetical protein [Oscillospiraceae bacterium]